MLTRSQVQRLAQRHRIGMQVQARDYLQHLALSLLYFRSQALVFKGGTALRLVYRGNRYSEDLDFSVQVAADASPASPSIAELEVLWQDVVADMRHFGCEAEVRNAWVGEFGYSFDLSYRGPLYDGRDHSKGKVRIDISLRSKPLIVRRELVRSEYDDIRPFVVTVLAPEHLLAEKVRALLVRAKPRDLYDVWLMVSQGTELDPALVSQKLQLYGMTATRAEVEVALARARDDWERDLRPLLPQYMEPVVTESVASALLGIAVG